MRFTGERKQQRLTRLNSENQSYEGQTIYTRDTIEAPDPTAHYNLTLAV